MRASSSEPGRPRLKELTVLLNRWCDGDRGAAEAVWGQVYDALRALAASRLRRDNGRHTLAPSDLVSEAYMRLRARKSPWQNREQFMAIACRIMRYVLIDHARGKGRLKRRGEGAPIMIASPGLSVEDVLAVHQALERLEEIDSFKARIAELKFFGGLSVAEIGVALEASQRTVARHWTFARAWLSKHLEERPDLAP